MRRETPLQTPLRKIKLNEYLRELQFERIFCHVSNAAFSILLQMKWYRMAC